jgi:hypothetical protein
MQRRKRVYQEESESETEQHDDAVKPSQAESQPTQPIPKSKKEVIEIIEIFDLDEDEDTSCSTRPSDASPQSKEDAKIFIKLGGKRVESENQQRDRRSTPPRLFMKDFCLLKSFNVALNFKNRRFVLYWFPNIFT